MPMRAYHRTFTAAAEEQSSAAIGVSVECSGYSYALDFSAGGVTAELQYTLDDIYSSAWTESAGHWVSLGARSADYAGQLDRPVVAFRLLYSGTPDVTVTLSILEIV